MKLYFIFLSVFVCLYSAPDDFQTLQMNFLQTVTNDQNQTLKYSGKVWLKTPDMARYEYESPQKKSVAISGGEIIMIEYDLEQATKYKRTDLLNIIDSWKSSEPVTDTKRVAKIDGLTLYIEHNRDAIERIYYIDNFDNFVEIALSDPVKNKTVDNSFFIPKVPTGFDLIREE
ncbi:MAG: LolA-like outer membrane lipoprotein chaperone [Helicobacteraceae bacterium]|jgi:outer membrane lipoprotein-sorting protein|nr:LolA-like outer membrane lipoprotein chaperone [Helicobacteraceae bacterium]